MLSSRDLLMTLVVKLISYNSTCVLEALLLILVPLLLLSRRQVVSLDLQLEFLQENIVFLRQSREKNTVRLSLSNLATRRKHQMVLFGARLPLTSTTVLL